MKTEQELFVKKYREVFNVDKSLFVNDDGEFTDSFCQSIYEMWQASAYREGYKLVPVEPTRKMEMAGMSAGAGFVSRSIYKAMIGACE